MLDRVAELDGVRGIAILLVMVFHFGSVTPSQSTFLNQIGHEAIGFGWCGVDLFFVLSGFLITGILLDSKGSLNYFSVFYARRVLRILPLYYFAVFVFFQVIPLLANRFGWNWTKISSTEQVWYWLHVSNWRTAFQPLVYPQVTHFWSLAIEEQFYLVWPAIVLVCSRRRLLQVCVFLIVASAVARNLPQVQELSAQYSNLLYRLTPFRSDSLLMGAAGALIVRDQSWTSRAHRWLKLIFALSCLAVAAVVAAAGTTSPHSGAMTRFGYSALGLLFVSGILYSAWHTGGDGIARILRSGLLTSFGKYSYAMYLVHAPLIPLVRVRVVGHGVLSIILSIVAGMVATYVLALLSWNCLERHFLKLKGRFRYRRPQRGPSEMSVAGPVPAARDLLVN